MTQGDNRRDLDRLEHAVIVIGFGIDPDTTICFDAGIVAGVVIACVAITIYRISYAAWNIPVQTPEFINQGEFEDRSFEQTLDIGWDLLSDFPERELKRCDPETISWARDKGVYKPS